MCIRYDMTSSVAVLTTSTVTNAAGGLNPAYDVGDIVVLKDVRFVGP